MSEFIDWFQYFFYFKKENSKQKISIDQVTCLIRQRRGDLDLWINHELLIAPQIYFWHVQTIRHLNGYPKSHQLNIVNRISVHCINNSTNDHKCSARHSELWIVVIFELLYSPYPYKLLWKVFYLQKNRLADPSYFTYHIKMYGIFALMILCEIYIIIIS